MGCFSTLVLRLLFGMVIIILPGQIGVVIDGLAAESVRVFQPGIHFYPMVGDLAVYPTEPQTYFMVDRSPERNDSIQAITRDGQRIAVSLEVVYQVDVRRVSTLYRRWGTRYEAEYIRPVSRSSVRDVTAGYGAQDLYALSEQLSDRRDEIEQAIFDQVAAQFRNEGLLLEDIRIQRITFDPAFTQAMEARKDAEQRLSAAQTAAAEAKSDAERAARATQTAVFQQTATPTPTATPANP